MAKPIETVENFAGGIDLLTERDSGNLVRILTGRKDLSLQFWESLAEVAEEVVEKLSDAPKKAKASLEKQTLDRIFAAARLAKASGQQIDPELILMNEAK